MTVAWTRRALQDLEQIHEFVSQRSRRGAAFVLRRIEATADLCDRHPGAGRPLRVRRAIRTLPVGKYPYRIYYTASPTGVIILHVRHAARRAPGKHELDQ